MIVHCLQCLRGFPWESYVYVDGDGQVHPQLRNRPESRAARMADRMRGVKWAEDTDRAEMLAKGLQMQCPDGHWVPADLNDNRTLVIGLIGPPGSSKSHYLAAAIGQMVHRDGLAAYNLAVNLHQSSDTDFNTRYYTPVWRERRVLPATPPAEVRRVPNPPIAVELREVVGRRKWNLVFFDSAGEDVKNSVAQAKHARYLARADGMIFLVEPGNIEGMVEAGLAEPSGTDAVGIVRNTANLLRDVRNRREEAGIGVPAAVVMAKSDLLDKAPDLPAEWATNLTDGARPLPGDLAGIRQRSDALVPFLRTYHAVNLTLNVLHAFPDHTFHLASATGGEPLNGAFPDFRPRRCLDPVVALLCRLVVLDDDGLR